MNPEFQPSNSFQNNPQQPQRQVPGQPGQPPEEESLTDFTLTILKVFVYGTLATFGVYTAFIVSGAIFDQFLDGDLKLAAALILAVAIPLFTAVGDNSRKEQGERVRGPLNRLNRTFIGTAIFSFGTAALVSMTMAGNVAGQLRNNPNWFLKQGQEFYAQSQQTPFEEFNRKYSTVIADMVETVATPLGIYSHEAYRADAGDRGQGIDARVEV